MFTKYEKNHSKTVVVVDYNAKKLPKWLSLKGCNSLKSNPSSIKNLHAHLQYVWKVWETFVENCKRSWLHKLHILQYEKAAKTTKFKRP